MAKMLTTVDELKRWVRRERRNGRTLGLVPTMGALHEGHLSLMRRATKENDRTAVSIFVNPTQFGPGEDLNRYPRQLDEDVALCGKAKVNVVFAPTAQAMYPEGFCTCVEVEGALTKGLCGASRPGHFRGVTTVVTKLFNLVEPDRAYFGEKDYQQLAVIRRMVADLNMNVEIVACPTVREADGLATSSRNRYLEPPDRKNAPVLWRALCEAKRLIEEEGVRDAAELSRAIRALIRKAPRTRIDYLAVVDSDTLAPLRHVSGRARVALAVFVNKTRLIDNIAVEAKGKK